MSAALSPAAAAAVVAPRCNGCSKPVDPAISLKRPVHSTTSYGRYRGYSRALAQPYNLHFCDAECRRKADEDAARDRYR